MTIASTARKAGPLLGTGTQTAFPFTFKVFAAGDLLVTRANALGIETALALDVDYTVTLNSNQETSPGGTVTLVTAPAVGEKLVIVGNVDYDQPLDLPSGGNFSPLALENQLDRAAMQIQQLREIVGRALQVSVSTGANVGLPVPKANTLIGWDSTAEDLQNFSLESIATALAFATYRYDTFTGNGVQTAFNLATDPVNLGNIDVSLDGLTAVPGADYTLASGVLVFAVAPPVGVQILARYGQGISGGYAGDATDIHFQQAGAGAVPRTLQDKARESVSVKDFGAAGDGVTDDTVAIQAALDYAGSANVPLEVVGKCLIGRVLLKYPSITVFSQDADSNGFVLIPQTSAGAPNYVLDGYFMKQNTVSSTDYVCFDNVGFDGQYDSSAWTGKTQIACIRIRATGGATDASVVVKNCTFLDPQDECVGVSPDKDSFVLRVNVTGCSATVTDPATSTRTGNLIRTIIDYVGAPSATSTYNKKNIRNISVSDCYATGIRTLADLKRGSVNYVVSNCQTENMSDCHHSVDGGSSGVLTGLVGRQTLPSGTIPTKNFVEIQGENIVLDDFEYSSDIAYGGIAGVLVQDYADPAEGAGAAHQSKGVTVRNAVIDGVNSHAVRMQNTRECTVDNITARNCALDAVAMEYIADKTDPVAGALSPVGNVVDKVFFDSTVRYGVNAPTTGSANRIGVVFSAAGARKVEGANLNTWSPLYGVDYTEQNLLMLMDAAGTLPVGFKRSSASVTITQETSDVPVDYGIAVTVNGADAAVLDSIEPFQRLQVSRGDIVQLDLHAKLNTATACGVLLQEFNGATFLSSNFLALSAVSGSWTKNTVRMPCNSAGVNQVRIQLLPNASSNNAAAVGISRFAGVRFGRALV